MFITADSHGSLKAPPKFITSSDKVIFSQFESYYKQSNFLSGIMFFCKEVYIMLLYATIANHKLAKIQF